MEKLKNRENFFFRFSRSNAGRLVGIVLIGFATVETANVVNSLREGDANDLKVAAGLDTAYLTTASAIFLARRAGNNSTSSQR